MNYDMQALSDYYKSATWAKKRSERLRLDGYKCAKCGFTRALEVHHITYDRLFHEDVSRDLITLCKSCHNEIEAQKRAINPIGKRAEHHSVYLAGKISPYDWRAKFGYCFTLDHEDIAGGCIVHVNDSLSITGPFFISCDHGCYHGEGSHGVGASDGGCMGHFFSRKDVLEICKQQIDRAEILFAYIDCCDCYGTLAEIGYAHAKGKDIVIVFSNPEIKKEMWFVDTMKRNTGIASLRWRKEQLLAKFKED